MVLALAVVCGEASGVEILRSTGGLAADVVGLLRDPATFQRAPDGIPKKSNRI